MACCVFYILTSARRKDAAKRNENNFIEQEIEV